MRLIKRLYMQMIFSDYFGLSALSMFRRISLFIRRIILLRTWRICMQFLN